MKKNDKVELTQEQRINRINWRLNNYIGNMTKYTFTNQKTKKVKIKKNKITQ